MAGRAVRPIFSAVMVIGRMTGITGCGRALELHILVALGAKHSGMFAGQFETGIGMVKGAGLPR